MPRKKVVLAYSGGLDTSVSIKWIPEKYGLDVITVTMDIGNQRDLQKIKEKALKLGVHKAIIVDIKDLFVNYFVWPGLQANALYEGKYPLSTALARPLTAKTLVDVARKENASAVAHGCTGKGNDQVRFDLTINTLAPDLQIIAPVREWRMNREEEIEYAAKHKIPVEATIKSPYSTDVNLWGRSIECGVLENPWQEPPEEVYEWTKHPDKTPNKPLYVEITFEKGVPIKIDGKEIDSVKLIEYLNKVGGEYGVGRIDHIENRLIGIKSREVYEVPAAMILLEAHKSLEDITLTKDVLRFKKIVEQQYADLIYNGQWFSALHQDLAMFIASTQRYVTGTVRMRLYKGKADVVGRKSPKSLYSYELSTYDKKDAFDHNASVGFIKLWGLPQKIQVQLQLNSSNVKNLSIMPPKADIKHEEKNQSGSKKIIKSPVQKKKIRT